MRISIAHMRAAGISAEQILKVVEEAQAEEREKARIKKQNQRSRPRDSGDNGGQEEKKTRPNGRAPIVFERGVIRLTQKGMDDWRVAFPHLDLEGELYALADWAGREPNWFPAVSGALNKRNREMKVKLEQARHQNGAAKEPANDLNSILNR